jgi:hypothetical protein
LLSLWRAGRVLCAERDCGEVEDEGEENEQDALHGDSSLERWIGLT